MSDYRTGARWLVPKMVKNGFKSPSGSRRADTANKSGRTAKQEIVPKYQKRKNKNHLKPISGQASAPMIGN